MSQTITVKFVDFWKGFDANNNKLLSALRAGNDVTVLPCDSEVEPDLLIYSRDGYKHLRYENSIKIYYTGENDVPDFNECDYAISFHHIDFGPRHLRYPLYMMYGYEGLSTDSGKQPSDAAFDRPFCSFLMRNYYLCDPRRIEIVDAVDAYRPIAYGGPWRNNVGGPVDDKLAFISGYKFNLALENSLVSGYITEKLLEPLLAGTVPVYWGADDVTADFNSDSFIRVRDYDNMDSFISGLKRIDGDRKEYMSILSAPKLNVDKNIDFDSRLESFFSAIVEHRRRYVTRYGEAGLYHDRRKLLAPFLRQRSFFRLAKLVNLCSQGRK